jgi:hypothetical protein
MFCVYQHIRPDTDAVFYVGKGGMRRAHSRHQRNQHWNNVVSKAGGFATQVVVDGVDEELAFLAEMELIDQFHRLGARLTNKTDGGEGPSGMRHTEEARRKISEAQRGEKHWTFGMEITADFCAKMRKAREKLVFTDEIRAKISEAGKRRVYTPETKAKMSKAKQGSSHHMANAVMFEGKIFGCAKELSEYTGVNYSTIRTRIRLYPEKFGYAVLGYTKDLKGLKNGKHEH